MCPTNMVLPPTSSPHTHIRTLVKPEFVSAEYEGITGEVGVDAWGHFGTPTSVTVEVVRLQKGEWCELTPNLER